MARPSHSIRGRSATALPVKLSRDKGIREGPLVLILLGDSAASIPRGCKRCLFNGVAETFGLIGVALRRREPYAPNGLRERGSDLTEIRLWFPLRSNGLRQEATP